MSLRNKIIRLAHSNPELREHLLPLVTKTSGLRDTVEQSITDTIMMPKQVLNDQKLEKFLKVLSKELGSYIQSKYGLGIDVFDDPRKGLVYATILGVEITIVVNRKTQMIDFKVRRKVLTIDSMSWSSASIKSIMVAIEEKMQEKLEDYYFRYGH